VLFFSPGREKDIAVG